MIQGVYLSYPIDQQGSGLASLFERIERFKIALVDRELAAWVFDPGDAFRVGRQAIGGRVALINRAALNQAHLIVAFLPAGTPTIGVPMEIDRARAQGKHVLVFSDANSWMLELPQVHRLDGFDDDHIEEGLRWVGGLMSPETQRWSDPMFVKVHEGLGTPSMFIPQRAFDDDAGFDLVTSETVTIPPGAFADVPCGISLELPEGTWGLVTGRSSALRKAGLLIHSGVIDQGYRGPIFAGAFNLTDKPVDVLQGSRVAQLIVLNNASRRVDPVKADALSPSKRGEAGFGSTGD